ncbi:hypothetical protein RclHR1_12630014, partial [Rhizophagus clarus]
IRIPDDRYVNYFGQRILARDVPAHHQNEPRLRDLYYHYTPYDWAEKKKYQLYIRLTTVAYIVTFIKSYQQGYRFVSYGDWSIMLKYLANPEHYRTTTDSINIYVHFVKISEYIRYKCKKAGKPFSCNSLEIDMFKSDYIPTINGGGTIIDFSDFNNNFIQRAYRNYKKRPKSLAKRIWEAVRNDGTSDRKKLLGITPRDTYPAPSWPTRDDEWIIEKKWQLSVILANVTYGIVFKKLYQRGYIIIRGLDWSNQLMWLQNPDYYRIDKDNIEYIIRVTECEKYKANSWSIKSICERVGL